MWRQHAVQFSTELRHIVKTLATALVPLEEALSVFRCASAKQVAAAKRPAFMAATSLLLRWPDLQQPVDLLKGYNIVGEFPVSGVFRPVQPAQAADFDSWLGPDAEEAISKVGHLDSRLTSWRLSRRSSIVGFVVSF